MKHDPDIEPAPEVARLPDGARELRRFLRHRIKAEGSTRFNGRTYRVTLEDLSEQGCQFRVPWGTGFPARTTIALRIGELGPFQATVRWCRMGWIGVEFDLPVYGPVLDHMRSTLGVEDGPAPGEG